MLSIIKAIEILGVYEQIVYASDLEHEVAGEVVGVMVQPEGQTEAAQPEGLQGDVIQPDGLQGEVVRREGEVVKPEALQGEIVQPEGPQGDVVQPDGEVVQPEGVQPGSLPDEFVDTVNQDVAQMFDDLEVVLELLV